MSSICDDLRSAILQAAMQGKLTERLETDDSSEYIKEKIISERSQYKNCKFLDGSENDVTIPDEWCSLKAGEVFELLIGEKVASGDKLPLLDAKYFRGKQKTFTDKGNLAKKDDVLILVDGENSGETFLCTEYGYMGSTFKALFIPKCLNKDFALYFLEMNRKVLRDNKRGAAIPHLDKKLFFNFIFPIPSLAEQKRIVEKVDELMARVADLEQSADALASLKKAFPDDIKASLLQAAMQGKLTERLPEDGDAEELLNQIKAEKEKLIAEGKIKKQKPLAPITDDEIPFSIPDNWKWVRVGDIFNHNTGKTKNASQNSAGTSRKYITTSNMYWNFFDFTKVGTMNFKDDELEKYTVKKGDLLVCEGGDFGRTAIWNYDEEVCFQNHIHRLRFFKELSHKYFYWLFYFYKSANLIKGKGIGIQGLSSGALHNIVFPLPPLAEQKRIVDRLEDLMQNINMVGDLIASE